MNKKAYIVIGIFLGIFLFVFIIPFLFPGKSTKTTNTTTNGFSGELVFWNLFDEEDLYSGLIQEYQSRHPNVRISYKKYTSLKDYEHDFINELAEGKGPDILAISPSWVEKHAGKLLPMPEASFFYANPAKFKDTFFAVAAKDLIRKEKVANTTEASEKVYALPIMMDSLGILYNRTLLNSDAAKNIPSFSWTDLQQDIKLMTRKSSNGLTLLRSGGALGSMKSISRSMDILHTLMLQNGTKFYDANNQDVTLLAPTYSSGRSYIPSADALTFFYSFGNDKSVNFSWSDTFVEDKPEDKELGAFAKGKVAMIFGYSYYISELERLINQYKTTSSSSLVSYDALRTASLPQVIDSASANETKLTLANYFPLAVAKNSKSPETSWDFINFLAQQDQQRYLFRKGKKLSARFDLTDEQIKDPLYGSFARQNIYATSIAIPDPDALGQAYMQNFSQLQKGTVDENAFLKSIQMTLQCQLDKQNQKKSTPACVNESQIDLQR